MPDPKCIISPRNEVWWFSEFMAHSTSNYRNSNLQPGTSPDKRQLQCVYRGSYIPIYQIMREEYAKPDSEMEYYYVSGRGAYFGKVLATHIYNTNQITAIVAQKYLGSTFPSYEQRQADIANGKYSYDNPITIGIYTRTKNTGIDYSRYDYGMPNHDWKWTDSTGVPSTMQRLQIAGYMNWEDGTASGLINQMTLLFPYIIYSEGSEYAVGLSTRIYKNSTLQPYAGFESVVVSEEQDLFISLNQATCTTQLAGYGYDFDIYDYHSGYEPPEPPADNPFEDDYNEGGGGTGEYTDTSDTIPIDGTPTNSAIASGFVNAYVLTQQQATDFHAYLYSDNFLENVKKLMIDPIDYILSFMLAPYTPDTGGSASTSIVIGGTNSGVNASIVASGYKTIDCGTITLKEFWGKFYDYNPYTKVQIYLPFIGMRPLDIDDVMAGQVNLTYRIDVLTGACVATVSVNNARGTNGAVYNFNGNCHAHIPVSGKNYLETVTNVIQAGVGMAGSIASGNALGVASGAINVMRSAKEQLEHAGELTGATGLLSNFTPFLMVSRPSQSLAQNYNHYKGFISNVTKTLSELTGYTEVAELVQTNIHCTLDEFEEINDLLKSGVYL